MPNNNAQLVNDIDLPWNKLQRTGPEGMRDEELLAIALKKGYGHCDVVEKAGGIMRKYPVESLLSLKVEDLEKISGIGKTKALLLSAVFELAKRGLNRGLGIAPSISSPSDAVGLLSDIKDSKKEHFI